MINQNDLIKHIQPPTLPFKMEWIKVTEELPSYKKSVYFTFCNDGEIHKDIWYDYYKKDWMKEGPMSSYGVFKGKVTHWMPLPEPPKD